ncbi:MAG: type I restriction enzyme HsdR N-terminal domain-containing protein [Planctomycetota bacterium]
MIRISKRTLNRLRDGLKKYQKVVLMLRERDVSEADTVTVVKDILADVFGYDKYLELTGEYQIRGTYCDLAVKIDNKVKYLIEVKAAGVDLNSGHLRQAVDYAAKEGLEWVVLTNGISWHLHRVKFGKPITNEEVAGFSLADLDLRRDDDRKKMFLLSREAINEGAMDTYHQHSQLLNRYTIAQIIRDEAVVTVVRREFRKLFPEIKVDKEELLVLIDEEILKRDVIENERAKDAASRVKRAAKKRARRTAVKKPKSISSSAETVDAD